MEITCHYYALLCLCRICGLSKEAAYKIAFASQFVDENKTNSYILKEASATKRNEGSKEFKVIKNVSSRHSFFQIKTVTFESMIYNTVLFHFFPDTSEDTRKMPFIKKMKCKENPPLLYNFIIKNLKEMEPERLGMLFHVYADTFSHQDFCGLISKLNNIEKLQPFNLHIRIIRNLFSLIGGNFITILLRFVERKFPYIMPAYGHAKALHYPDKPTGNWSYRYDKEYTIDKGENSPNEINNNKRYKTAFHEIFNLLNLYVYLNPDLKDRNFNDAYFPELKNNKKIDKMMSNLQDDRINEEFKDLFDISKEMEEMKEKFDDYLAKKNTNKRTWRKFLQKKIPLNDNKLKNIQLYERGNPALRYNEDTWVKEAFANYKKQNFSKWVVKDAQINSEYFKRSSFYKFIKSVKWYQQEILSLLKEKELEIPLLSDDCELKKSTVNECTYQQCYFYNKEHETDHRIQICQVKR